MNNPIAILTRREVFSASHRLYSHSLSDEENKELFGKCYYPNGHGHNYVLEVSVRGPINEHGLVMNLDDLKPLINEHIISKVDHRHLNIDVEEFKTLNPTAENIAYIFWQWLKPSLGELLFEIKIHETENNIATYRGD